MEKPIWKPSAERVANANLTAFIAAVERDWGLAIDGYPALHDFSVEHPDRFWTSVWHFCGMIAERRGDEVVRGMDRMPGARWFPGARLNFAQNLLRRRDSSDALVYLLEDRGVRRLSFARLHDEVSRVRQALAAAGVGPGDRVAGYLPNMPETVVAMLATTSLGAIWCACSPDFGVEAAVDRFGQVDPAILFAADGYSYNGRTHACLDKAAAIADRLPSLARVVLVPNLDSDARRDEIPNAVAWEDFLGPFPPGEIDFPQFDFDHPVLILYTSGTTGPPKCILHGAGGILIENLKGTALNFDVKPGDRIFWWTTSGWVVWYFLVLTLGCEATLLLYDGSPSYPTPAALMDFAAAERATFMRLSPRFVDIMADAGLEPARTHDLDALKTITVAGAPFSTAGYRYIYEKVKRDVHLASPAGGTDPMASLVGGNPIAPVWPGEIQARGLGIQVETFDAAGQPVRGAPGEMVVTMPFPSMPLGFWNDPGGERYRAAYFNRYPGVWRQGDWAEFTPRGGILIHGRSDSTLKARGVRIGTAEIYRQLERIEEIADSVVVEQDWQGDTRIVLFVHLRDPARLDDALVQTIKTRLRTGASPRHVPDRVIQVRDIPRTSTGKVSEFAVRAAIHGREVTNRDALQNPESLLEFGPGRLPELSC